MIAKDKLGYIREVKSELYDLLNGDDILIKKTDNGMFIRSVVIQDGVKHTRIEINMISNNGSVFGWVTSNDRMSRHWYGSRSLHPMTWTFIKKVLEL